jgi:class 3 adenylate cyclase
MDDILNEKTVLVVDDAAVTRILVADILGQSGVRVLEADSGERALQVAGDHIVDAFLLDIRLPDRNGIELCRSLRALERYKGTPIMFVTAIDQREILQWALEAGCDDFMQKPIDPIVLRKRLGNLLQKAAYVRQIELMTLSLRRYVSPRTEEIARMYATTRMLPGPRQVEVCTLFSDARGFTELARALEAEALFQMLSEHLGAQAEIVYEHGGYVDKFAGDGIMAVFDGAQMVRRCCLCALQIMDMSAEAAARRGSRIGRLGIGIHKGLAIVGNLGTRDHLDYTVIGDAVNIAARLCGIADMSIVVSQAVHDAAAGIPGLKFDGERVVALRGLREPLTVYDLVRGAGPA